MEITNPPVAPTIPDKANNRKLILMIGLGIAVVVVIVAAAYFFYRESKGDSSGVSLPKLSESSEITNPIQFFYKNFSAKDYRVRIIEVNNQGYSFYYEKGALVRIDKEGTYGKKTSSIIKNGKLYTISDTDKTFVEMSLDDPKSAYILGLYKVGTILDPLLQGETPNATPWSSAKPDPSNKNLLEYQTAGRKLFAGLIPGYADLMDIKVILDSSTGLISSAAVRIANAADWNAVNFQYEEVDDIESLKKFPMDYKKVDPL